MSAQLGKWKEEQILVICPGSQTTMAQLGCGELTPPALRIPTRMFQDEETGEWRASHVEKRRRATANGDATKSDDEWEYIEDPDSTEGATYPIQGVFSLSVLAALSPALPTLSGNLGANNGGRHEQPAG